MNPPVTTLGVRRTFGVSWIGAGAGGEFALWQRASRAAARWAHRVRTTTIGTGGPAMSQLLRRRFRGDPPAPAPRMRAACPRHPIEPPRSDPDPAGKRPVFLPDPVRAGKSPGGGDADKTAAASERQGSRTQEGLPRSTHGPRTRGKQDPPVRIHRQDFD